MIALGLFEPPARLLAWFYQLTNNYILAISMIALVVMLITAPLVLKQTKGMLEMQKLQPEMRKLQAEHRGDRQKLNEEMMKLYQEHKVNPLASCFPLLLQFPVFIIMFRVLHGLTSHVDCAGADLSAGAIEACRGKVVGEVFYPKYLNAGSKLYQSLFGKHEMLSWGLDLSKRPVNVIGESLGKGLVYALLVVALGGLYFLQQRMVAARASISPTMSASQQKIMQYLPVVFAVFLVFYLTGLVIYYMAQAIFRIGLQYYITRRFYKGEMSLGQQAQRAGAAAREMNKDNGGGGPFAQMKRDLAAAKEGGPKAAPKGGTKNDAGGKATTKPSGRPAGSSTSKRLTPPKNAPTPSGRTGRPSSTGRSGRPTPPAPRGQKKK